ncbi:MAG: hypothetical protein OWS74_05595 [Firmicutes bacterium]|nr:hypothetical protein [Bacillota bacterium]
MAMVNAFIVAGLAGETARKAVGRSTWWLTAPLLLAPSLSNQTAFFLGGLFLAWGFELYGRASEHRSFLDNQERLAESFLLQLGQLLKVQPALSAVLQEILGAESSAYLSAKQAPEYILADYVRHWPFRLLAIVADGAVLVKQHGGNLNALVQQAMHVMQRERRNRQQRQLEEKSQISTAILLAGLPLGMLLAFYFLVPAWYGILAHSWWGHIAVIGIGLFNGMILAGVAAYLWKEDRER